MSAHTLRRVKKVTAEVLKKKPEKIADDACFVEDLGAESVQSIELIAALEEEFGIEMDEDDALAVKNVSNAVDFIDKLLAKKRK